MRELVKWPELARYFADAHPSAIREALDNQTRVQLDYKGVWFFIEPKTICTCHLRTRTLCLACNEQVKKERSSLHELIQVFGPAAYKIDEGFVN